jgi:hypothetical protein
MIEVKATFGLHAKGVKPKTASNPNSAAASASGRQAASATTAPKATLERLLESHLDMKAQRPRLQALINGSFPRIQFTMPLRWRQCKDVQLQLLRASGVCTQAHRAPYQPPMGSERDVSSFTSARKSAAQQRGRPRVEGNNEYTCSFYLKIFLLLFLATRFAAGNLHDVVDSVRDSANK